MGGANEESSGIGFSAMRNTKMIHPLLQVSLSLSSGSAVKARNVSARAGGACPMNRLCNIGHQALCCFSSSATRYGYLKNISTCKRALFLIINNLSS